MDLTQQTPAAPPTGTSPAQPPATPAAAPGTQQENQQPLTREVVQEIVEKAFQRAQQSSRDRDRNIETAVVELRKTVEGLGITVTPDMLPKLREKAEATVDQQAPAPGQAAEEKTPGEENPVYKLATAYYKTTGVEIKTADPEWAGLQKVLDDPNITDFEDGMVKFQIALHQAVEAKKARVASQSQNPQARTLGEGNNSGGVVAKSARDYWANAHPKT